MTVEELRTEIQNGGKFVIFQYCFSIIVMTFKQGSDIYFIPANQGSIGRSLKYSLITFLLGWWGFPWGPIYSIGALFKNISGGIDVTADVMASLNRPAT